MHLTDFIHVLIKVAGFLLYSPPPPYYLYLITIDN